MKKEILFLLMIIVTGILLSGCSKSKDEPQPEPEPQNRNLKFKVIEYQTNSPISGAKLELSRCIPLEFGGGCSSIITVGTWFSDKDGEILIKSGNIHGSVNMNSYSKDNYWSKNHADTAISTETQDSSVVRLFPYSWLKIHLRNEVLHADSVKILLHTEVVFDSIANDYSPSGSFEQAANNLDTTMIYATFGNIKNKVEASIDSSGVMKQVYSKTQFVNKNDTLSLEILLK